jgi:uncharacterized membrane protein YphA (DoxX/SURF4 family)
MDWTVKWVGEHVFHTTITIGPAGSGDTTWNYVQLACFGAIAGGAALLWSLIDWWSTSYARLHDWLRAYLRFYLSMNMFGYGLAKVIKTQFQTPGLDALMQPLGDGSPMGLLWNFMGFSDAYCFFVGAAEVLGGLLLIARRTTPLGALVTVVVMSNVAMLNFCFDTPVKLFSLNLLAMAVFLLLPDAKRLFDVLVLHRLPTFTPLRPLFRSPWLHWSAVLFRSALIGWVAWSQAKFNWEAHRQYGDVAPKPPLYGTWDVEVFEADGEIVPEGSEASADRWQRLRIGRYRLGIEHRGGLMQIMYARVTPKLQRFELASTADTVQPVRFTCELTEPDALTLDGAAGGRKLHIELTRNPAADYFLTSRGFHWINEYPLNR